MGSTKFVLRPYRRFPVCYSFYYDGDGFVGEGTVWNLSPGGWRASGTHPVRPGMDLTLRLFLPDQELAIEVDRATVQWVRGEEFGLQIATIHPEEQARLGQFVTSLVYNIPVCGVYSFPAGPYDQRN